MSLRAAMIPSMHRDLPRLEKHDVLARLAEGPQAGLAVLTPNNRLAQALRADFDRGREAAGLAAWEAADILPFEAFVERLWEDALYSELAPEIPALLAPAQERALWEQCIEARRPDERLFSTPAAAAQCMDAWRLAHGWRMEIDGGALANEDSRAFAEWSARYRHATREHAQTDRARLADVVAAHVGHPGVARPANVALYGFDLLTPQQRDFLEAMRSAGSTLFVAEPAPHAAEAVRVEFTQARDEIVAAARWARACLERRQGRARIGVVVPDLARSRARVHRIFADILQPDHLVAGASILPFEISLGSPLAAHPLVADALRALELAGDAAAFEDASRLLRSPFIGGAETELDARARLDERLRRRCAPSITLDRLARAAASPKMPHAPMLLAHLERLAQSRKPHRSALHGAAEWAKAFSESLAALGFPGERTLDSGEYQALARWHELLAEFATLERVSGKMAYEAARQSLARMAADAIFQPQGREAPIRILGVLESAGLEFDHLWVMGLTDEAWPLPARPNPFVPVRLQRKAGIPQSDPVLSLELDRRITEGWMRAAEQVVVSHARMKGESELAPSPLIAAIGAVALDALDIAPLRTLRGAIHATGKIETLGDANAPPVVGDSPGAGTRVFRDQAACPFRAFAHVRLACEALEAPRPGLDARDRGTLVHCMLAAVWKALGTRDRLAAMTPAELDALLESSATEALDQVKRYRHDALSGRFGELERARLVRAARDWLKIEERRDAFEVVAIEEKRALAFGGVTVNVKLDRVDRLEDGSHVVLDYKTGECNTKSWLGARPEEPQMPMYALGVENVAAVAFAQVKAGKMGFRGLQRTVGILPTNVKTVDKDYHAKPYVTWNGLMAALQRELEAIGVAFAAGDARVDPKRGSQTCAMCDQQMSCRIAEKAPFGAAGGGESDE